MKIYACAALAAMTLAACTTTQKVASVQPMDTSLTCSELKAEFAKLDQVQEEADHNKGVNTANVAAVLFFWPAAVGNYMDADKAEKMIEKRRTHLMGVWNSKKCAAEG